MVGNLRFALLVALVAVLAPSCGGGSGSGQQVTLPDLAPRMTTATLAGPLCKGTACRCADQPADAGTPASSAHKRYEVKLGPSDSELWATVGDMQLYKSVERATDCFYVDLPAPGDTPVTLRATGDAGFGARISIRELNSASPAWYDTFDFACGAPGACRVDQLRDFRASLDKYSRGIHDPCGSTKIQGLTWKTGRMPDGQVPADLYLELTLKIYNFAPEHPPGHPDCKDNY
jgi:hypothetical protein